MGPESPEHGFDVAVVGAGAAGQMAAAAAAEGGRRVVVLEQMPRAGMKLAATGGGRGNLTSMAPADRIQAAFGRQGRFIGPALTAMGPDELRRLFNRLGVPTVVDDQSRVWPASGRAADVQAALTRHVEHLGVTVCLGSAVQRLWVDGGALRGVETSDGRRIASACVVLACGGQSWPGLGGTGGGYALARQAGHTIVDPAAALVPLITRERWPAELAGVAIRDGRLWIDLPKQAKAGIVGDVLFTHRGLSGPAVLDLSGTVAQLLDRGRPVPVRIELVAGMDAKAWARELESWRSASGGRQVVKLLQQHVPASLGRQVCVLAGLDPQVTAAQLSAARQRELAATLSGVGLTVTATEGFDAAFVTRGGVKLKEVDPATLRSRVLDGLYVVGELLDLDGPTGGYNLQWAFASGWLAGLRCRGRGDTP